MSSYKKNTFGESLSQETRNYLELLIDDLAHISPKASECANNHLHTTIRRPWTQSALAELTMKDLVHDLRPFRCQIDRSSLTDNTAFTGAIIKTLSTMPDDFPRPRPCHFFRTCPEAEVRFDRALTNPLRYDTPIASLNIIIDEEGAVLGAQKQRQEPSILPTETNPTVGMYKGIISAPVNWTRPNNFYSSCGVAVVPVSAYGGIVPIRPSIEYFDRAPLEELTKLSYESSPDFAEAILRFSLTSFTERVRNVAPQVQM